MRHFDLLPDVERQRVQLDPKVSEQFGLELIRMIREGGSDPEYRERVTGLIHGGADLSVMDQDTTALEAATNSGQTDIEDQLRRQMKLPSRLYVYETGNEVDVPPRIYTSEKPGPCPRTVVFNVDFTLNRRETVSCRFTDETTPGPSQTGEFKADIGRNTMSFKRMIGATGESGQGWIRFELIAATRLDLPLTS